MNSGLTPPSEHGQAVVQAIEPSSSSRRNGLFQQRNAETGLSYSITKPSAVSLVDWRALARKSITPSVFADPDFVAGLEALYPDQGIQVLAIADDQEEGLVGVWPFVRANSFSVQRLGAVRTLATPFNPVGLPLVAANAPWRVVETALSAFSNVAPVLIFDMIPMRSDLTTIVEDVAARHGLSTRVTGEVERPALSGGELYKTYTERNWSGKRRYKLRRALRKLQESGDIQFEVTSPRSEPAPVIDQFLRLEASGWKGREGTACAMRPETESFFRKTVTSLMLAGLCEIHSLTRDNVPVAMFVLFRANGHIWIWKIAYDERCARFAPGALLLDEVTRKVLARGDVFADSCATDQHSLATDYWSERVRYGTLHLGLTPGSGKLAMLASAAGEMAFDNAKSAFKKLRSELRARSRPD